MAGRNLDDTYGLVGHLLDGKYAVHAVVSRGGFGLVYHAVHQALGKPVALKVFAPTEGNRDGMDQLLEDFRREAGITARLRHPATVKALDFGLFLTREGTACPWMAMEWVEGETLRSHLVRRRGRGGRTPSQCMELLGPVLEALAEAHALGVAHRDLKPQNLMVEDPGIRAGEPRPTVRGHPPVRVLDFGIAKAMDPSHAAGSGHTRTGTRGAFSPMYAAPEQCAGTRTGPWTDVHALGLILTELLVDRHPYNDARDEALGQETFARERPTPGRFGVDVGAWEPVLLRALSMRPADRYPHAGALLAALEEALPRASGGARGSLEGAADAGASRAGAQPGTMAGAPFTTLKPSELPASAPAPQDATGPGLAPRRGFGALGLLVGVLALVVVGVGAGLRRVVSRPAAHAPAAASPPLTLAPAPAVLAAPAQPALEAPSPAADASTQPPEPPRGVNAGRRSSRAGRSGSGRPQRPPTSPGNDQVPLE
ncbi:MAG: serine/threonine protein kinase [Deltaproteobacteria bacterium]|nr:serine/threonine protein kinase [Deltaproteobacteria bacterium]